jgi:hypothetical protein
MVDCFDLFWSSRRELSRENEGHGQAGKSMYGRVEDSALQGGMLKKQDADEVDEKGRWKIRERTLSCPSIAVIEGFICILIRPARTGTVRGASVDMRKVAVTHHSPALVLEEGR